MRQGQAPSLDAPADRLGSQPEEPDHEADFEVQPCADERRPVPAQQCGTQRVQRKHGAPLEVVSSITETREPLTIGERLSILQGGSNLFQHKSTVCPETLF